MGFLSRWRSKSSLVSKVNVEGQRQKEETYPAVDLPPPPAVGARLGVDLHHVTLLQRQLAGVARAEVVARDGHADHLGREHWKRDGQERERGYKHSSASGLLAETRHKQRRAGGGWSDWGSLNTIFNHDMSGRSTETHGCGGTYRVKFSVWHARTWSIKPILTTLPLRFLHSVPVLQV